MALFTAERRFCRSSFYRISSALLAWQNRAERAKQPLGRMQQPVPCVVAVHTGAMLLLRGHMVFIFFALSGVKADDHICLNHSPSIRAFPLRTHPGIIRPGLPDQPTLSPTAGHSLMPSRYEYPAFHSTHASFVQACCPKLPPAGQSHRRALINAFSL